MKKHNIIIEFSSVIYNDYDTNIPFGHKNGQLVRLKKGDFKQYNVISGSVFNSEYSETLDSATIKLDHVFVEDRLYNIKPYDYVRVFDAESWDGEKYTFDHLYLINDYNEIEQNIAENIFSYTINLFSETKILEKIQCPNVVITHKVNSDGSISKKTIFQHIVQYMKLFVPKIKVYDGNGHWNYEYLIKIPSETEDKDFFEKFSVSCADLSFNYPTLRQLLTNLMIQIGCIPVIKNRKLTYLDFNKEAKDFNEGDYTVGHTINYIQRSLSSDSYVNSLVNTSSNILDSDNVVVSESLGFRDSNNVLLKQTSNLTLETKFPIYKVNKFEMCFLANGYVDVDDSYTNNLFLGNVLYFNLETDNNSNVTLFFGAPDAINRDSFEIWINKITIIVYNINERKNYKITEVSRTYYESTAENIIKTTTSTGSKVFYHEAAVGSHHNEETICNAVESVTLSINEPVKEGSLTVVYGEFKYVPEGGNRGDFEFYQTNFADKKTGFRKIPLRKDITKLVVENSVRNTLTTNFTDIEKADTIDKLSKYLYGTVGYSIGSNKITGFSSTYTQIFGYIFTTYEKNSTYIENIYNVALQEYVENPSEDEWFNFYRGNKKAHAEKYTLSDVMSFASLTFNIQYQPLNSVNISFVKNDRDIIFPIEQYSSGDSGLTDFDRMVISEQEKVDRIGNETLSISQRTKNFDDIQGGDNFVPMVFKDDLNRDGTVEDTKYIIFKRTLSIGNYKYDVNYYGSKDAILKNFFTSIRTKYRAFNYVDYTQSTLRKEKDIVYVLLSEKGYFDGDDKIKFLYGKGMQNLIFGFNPKNEEKNPYPVKYGGESSLNKKSEEETIKNDISMITSDYMFAIIYEQADNISAGPYIASSTYSTYYDDTTEMEFFDPNGIANSKTVTSSKDKVKLGGIPQMWQEWNTNEYNEKHEVFFTNYLDVFYGSSLFLKYISDSEARDVLSYTAHLPIVDKGFVYDYSPADVETFLVCDNNKDNSGKYYRTFYKDLSERINHTVQFIYYSDSDNIKWTEYFISNNGFIQRYTINPDTILFADNLSVNKNAHTLASDEVIAYDESKTKSVSGLKASNTIILRGNPTKFNLIMKLDETVEDNQNVVNFKVQQLLFVSSHSQAGSGVATVTSQNIIKAQDGSLSIVVNGLFEYQGYQQGEIGHFDVNYSFKVLTKHDIDKFVKIIDNGVENPYIEVDWTNTDKNVIKVVNNTNNVATDIIAFKRGGSNKSKFYVSLNDSRTEYVLAEQNGMLYKRFKLKRNTENNERLVEDLYKGGE